MEYDEKDEELSDEELLEKEVRELERLDKEIREKERLKRERIEQERLEQERLKQERLKQERLEQERLEQERLEQERLERERLERERIERERLEKLILESKLYPNNSLFIIPSWGALLGYPTLGTYVHHPVSKIETDIVIFFSGYDYSIETAKGRLYYLFGLGYHYLKFELESGKYVTDNRILTGLILPDFVYDHMATSSNITLEEDPDVIIAEKVIKVPINLSNKPENHLTFIKGALMRNVFIPNKDIILKMMDTIRQTDSYLVPSYGHQLLSSHWDAYNQILVSEKMRAKAESSYFHPTAGLEGIYFKANVILDETISTINLSIIEDNIGTLKDVYANLEYDPMYLFSILEKASSRLGSDTPVFSGQRDNLAKTKSKESIFASAEGHLFEFKSWPSEFPRKAKKEPIPLPKIVEQPSYPEVKERTSYNVETTGARDLEHESFELDTLKSKKVEIKPLPPPPTPEIKAILYYLKNVIESDYEMRSLGQSFEIARESVRQIGVSATTLHQKKVWEMSKYANIYDKKDPGFGLPLKEKSELVQKVDKWIFEIEEAERLERERLEKARLEKERLERLERERIEREKREQERLEAERLEKIRIEKEREEQERLKREELDRIEKEKQEELRLEQERIDKEREEQEALEREKLELKRLKQERREKEKAAKKEAKKRKKLEKQKKKIEKKKLKEQKKLKNL
jgi:hypothetical protein